MLIFGSVDPQVWIPLALGIFGGLVTIVVTLINKKATDAQSDLSEGNAALETLKGTVEGLKVMVEEQRAEILRKNEELAAKNEEMSGLRKDLKEERAHTTALAKLIPRLEEP